VEGVGEPDCRHRCRHKCRQLRTKQRHSHRFLIPGDPALAIGCVKGGEAINVVTSKTPFTQPIGKSDTAEWGGWDTSDFRSSSGRCARLRRLAEAHPQVLSIARIKVNGPEDLTTEVLTEIINGLVKTYPTPEIMRHKATLLAQARGERHWMVGVMRMVADGMESGELYEE
jgi:hypothetical protein